MRPSEFEAIRPHLQEAFDHIDAYLKRRQALENDKELHELFNRLASLPEGTPSKVKLHTLTEEEQEEAVRIYRSQPTACIEHAYPWRHLAAWAAVDLRDCGWIKEAEAIGEVLSELPTGPVDGRHPEIMDRQFNAIRAGAERIRTILTACLQEGSEAATMPPTPKAERGEGNGGTDAISQPTFLECLKKRAHNTPPIVYVLVAVAVIAAAAVTVTSLETIGNVMGRVIEWWRHVGPNH